ncbi:MAG: ATP-binding protein [Thermoplasmata archaeon]
MAMNDSYLTRVITDQKSVVEELMSKPSIIDREFSILIKKEIDKSHITVLTGIRRSGKSTSALLAVKNTSYVYINFDDPALYGFSIQDFKVLDEVISKLKPSYIILDEIQNVSGWEMYVSYIKSNKRYLITGSNSNLLSSEFSSKLTGRYIAYNIFPFSFSEFLKYKNIEVNQYLTEDIAKTKEYLSEYIELGGFPESYDLGRRYSLQLFNDILIKDVENRFKIKKYTMQFREMSKYLMLNTGNEISYSKLARIFKIGSSNTIKKYFSLLESAYLVWHLDKFSTKFKESYLSPKKIYSIDTAISISMGVDKNLDKGRLLETLIAIELQRRKSYISPELNIYYWKNYLQHEVDFVIAKGKKVEQLIQVCYSLENEDTKNREIRSLLAASKELKCSNLYILNWDREDTVKIEGSEIKIIPVWKWLLFPD